MINFFKNYKCGGIWDIFKNVYIWDKKHHLNANILIMSPIDW